MNRSELVKKLIGPKTALWYSGSMENQHTFSDPLIERYATREMVTTLSNEKRYQTWRQVWGALAKAEKELGLPITAAQLHSLEKATTLPIDFERVKQIESELQHDVMAHLHGFAEQCPEAKPILHLGATSAFVTDNADMILARQALQVIAKKLQILSHKMAAFSKKYQSTQTVGFTHFQVALPTTVGKRCALWLQDFLLDGTELANRLETLPLRGIKGTTGTQASFLKLFDGDHQKVQQLDQRVAALLGFHGSITLSGQTYTRKLDSHILNTLGGIGESAAKMASDLRLLQHLREIEEPFGKKQVGSSAMPFKRNPILSERICGLARMLMSIVATGPQTTANQWMERTLDDSAIRRLSLPRAFLLADAILALCCKIFDGIVVHEKVVARHLDEQLPFLLTEMLLMEGVKLGDDRQELHETLRTHSMQAFHRVVDEGLDNNLLAELGKEAIFAPLLKRVEEENWRQHYLTGRAAEQVDDLLNNDFANVIARLEKLTQ